VVLGDGLLQDLSDGPATVAVNRVTLPAGTDLPASDTPLMISRIDGNFSFVLGSGNVQVTRSASPALQPNAAPNSEFTLETGDAAFFPAGVTATSRADETADVSYYTLSVVPSGNVASDPATITFTAAPEPTETPESSATPSDGTSGTDSSGGLAAGTVVTALEDNLNIRTDPTTTADVVEQVAAGVELSIVSGPVEADDYTWYEVEIVSSGQTGWTVVDFLDTGAEATETPTGETSGAATPEAETGSGFAVGDAVVVSEEGVRIRTDASLDAEVIDTLAQGQALTITDGPVEAEDYTWYQVESEDGAISGWIVADFLESAA
jgi:uncharacterized protein YgiM (DUF1202 family)